MENFGDLLSRADNLKSKVLSSDQQFPFNSKSTNGEQDLRSIFRASDEIWKRKQLRSDPLGASRDSVTGALSKKPCAEPEQATSETTLENSKMAPLDQSTSIAFDQYIKRSAERAKIEAERAFINQHILDQTQSGHVHAKNKFSGTSKVVAGHIENIPTGVDLKSNDLVVDTFADYVSKLMTKSCFVTIESAVRDALKEVDEADSNNLWRKVFALCEMKRSGEDLSDVADFRSSDQWKSFVIEQATTLLQQTFKDHMETVIQSNLQEAQRGGVPGTLSLIEAYLNVRLDRRFAYEDGNYGKHPIWPFLFLCLRIGDYVLASKVATNLQNLSNCSILIKILAAFNVNQLVDGDRRFQLNAEWKHVMSICQDPYKRAVYAMILGHECPEVNNNIENWLWSRLMNCKLDPVNGLGHFYKLQTTICVDYGEEYFVGAGGKYSLYFTVLWLTGQIERAIDLLFRAEQRHHAAHIAILMYQLKLLNIGTYSSSPILLYDPKDPIYCQLNFSRLILLYVKNFELTNLDYTLSYCFFLRDREFENDGGLEGGNIFEACVSRLCFISDKVDAILGRMSETGDRIDGLIDKFASEIDVYGVIARVARDFDVSGDSLTACRLYILSRHPNEALQICSKQLSTYLSTVYGKGVDKTKELEDTVFLGSWLEKRYQQRPESGLQETYLGELSTLLKLVAFYTAAISDPDQALGIMKSLNLLPMINDELASKVENFSHLPEQVRAVLPDVVVVLMETLLKLYKDPSAGQSKRSQYRNYSNTILMYVAQTNQRFPVQINSKLLQLQSQLN